MSSRVKTENEHSGDTEAPSIGALCLPTWVDQWFAGAPIKLVEVGSDAPVVARSAERFTLLSIDLPKARQMDAATFQAAVRDRFKSLGIASHKIHAGNPVRMWNFIPHIAEHLDGLERYMIFNTGRHEGFADWMGDQVFETELLPTASGVGHHGDDFQVHCICDQTPGCSIENPRQTSAFRYSQTYGPTPPSFARGTVLGEMQPPTLLVAGTASVVGEVSAHVGNLQKQFEETLTNLATVVAVGLQLDAPDEAAKSHQAQLLSRFTDVTVYYPQASDLSQIQTLLQGRFGDAKVQPIQADLCRTDLLIEIEGLALLEDVSV